MRPLFTQPLDRVAFLAYLAGAVLPIAVLAALSGEAGSTWFASWELSRPLVTLLAVLLSLTSFLALRRSAVQSRRRGEQEREKLHLLLGASAELANALDVEEVGAATATHALRLSYGRVAIVLWRDAPDRPLRVLGVAGPTELLHDRTLLEQLRSAACEAITCHRLAMRRPGDERIAGEVWAAPVSAFVPLFGEHGAQGAIAVLHAVDEGCFRRAEVEMLSTLSSFASAAFSGASARQGAPVTAG